MELATSVPDHSISTPSSVMPILPAEPDCNPPNLWDDPSIHAANGEAVWWCLHTKPRQEKATARELGALGAVYYLPQVLKETRTPKGRKIQSIVPLFTGYMFLKGDVNDRLLALRGHRLVSVIEVVDQEALARDLRQVYTVLRSGLPVTAEDVVPVGATVRITTGPLTGMVGKVVRRAKRDQFVAVVRFLGRGAMVDLQDWQVEQVVD
jgi:transcription antitermination factor NusG